MSIRAVTKQAFRRVGLDVHRLDLTHGARRAKTFRRHGVNVVLDVGANEGQYVGWIREFGYAGRIVSFEPIPAVFERLQTSRGRDQLWLGVPAAIGSRSGQSTLHVTLDTRCSSMLRPGQISQFIEAAQEDSEVPVSVVTLDNIWADYVSDEDVVALKVDVQGFESEVLDGADSSLSNISVLEIEMSLLQLYDGAPTIHDLLPRLHDAGFEVVSVESGYVDEHTGQVLDIDVLLGRRE